MLGNLFLPEIREMIADRKFGQLRAFLEDWEPVDVADLISDLPEGDRVIVFRLLPNTESAEVFEYLDLENQRHLLRAMAHEEAVAVLNEMSADDRTALLEELPSNVVTQLLRLLTPEERIIAQTLLNYPEESVGRLMTPDFLAIRNDWTIEEALLHIRKHAENTEILNVLYVIDEKGHLLDEIRINELLIRPLDTKIAEVADSNLISLCVTDPQHEAVEAFKRYDRPMLPVTNGAGILVGIVTVDDVLDVAEEEATREIQKIGGMEALDEPYLSVSIPGMLAKRGPWLVVLFLGEMLTTSAMAFFEEDLKKAAVLTLFLPLIISSGGNSGSQATTLIIRAMAVGEVRLRDWWRVIGRELTVGVFLGMILGVLGMVKITIWTMVSLRAGRPLPFGEHWALIGLTVALTLVGVATWGTVSGSMLPFILRRCGMDPATSSAPFVATLVDVTGLIIYFTIAGLVLTGTLL